MLFADPSIAEPLPSTPMGSFTVSEPMHGSAAEAPTGTDDHSIAPGLAGAAAEGALVGAAVGAHEPAADPAGVGFEGTTASSMPYGTGPVESSATKGRGPLIAAVVVVGLLLIGAIAFALTRGGSNNDVATNSSTTQVPVTTAKAPKASSTTEADSSTSSTSTTIAESTTVPDDASTTSTPSSSADVTTPETVGSQTTTPPVTKAPVTTAAVAVISFSGPPDFGIIPKGGSVSFWSATSATHPARSPAAPTACSSARATARWPTARASRWWSPTSAGSKLATPSGASGAEAATRRW